MKIRSGRSKFKPMTNEITLELEQNQVVELLNFIGEVDETNEQIRLISDEVNAQLVRQQE